MRVSRGSFSLGRHIRITAAGILAGVAPAIPAAVDLPFIGPLEWTTVLGLALAAAALAVIAYDRKRTRRGAVAKAFLLDSYGTPLKEIVFRSECPVTLADAQKKLPGRGLSSETEAMSSGYRLRALHADNLHLILAYRGRLAAEQVDYAKFLMVSVQDRFDDAVRVHLGELTEREETVTTQEATLRQSVEEFSAEKADVEARAAEGEARATQAEKARAEVQETRAALEKARGELDARQAELDKNVKFLEKKALDMIDREEKIRTREVEVEQAETASDARAETVDAKERQLEADREELERERKKLKKETDRFHSEREDLERRAAAGNRAEFEEWRTDIDTRVKILQKKAFDLVDREEKLRRRDEELRRKEEQLRDLEARLKTPSA